MLLNITKVYSFFELLRADSLGLFYQGVTHDDITDKLISLSDANIKGQESLFRLRKKVSFAISECFQNIIRHQEEPQGKQQKMLRPSMFMIRNQGRGYHVGSVNLMRARKVRKLREQLQNLNKLSAEELRQMYLQMLPLAKFSEKGGAGLGLIEMARKSKQQFEFDFLPLTQSFSLFCMQLSFHGLGQEGSRSPSLSQVRMLYESLLQHKVMLLYKSDFSQEGMLPLIGMMENNLSEIAANRLLQKKVLYILVELFQNITKHAATINGRQEGVLLISASHNGFEVCTGNFIHNSQTEALEQQLERLNQLNEEELQQLYTKELVQAQRSIKGGAGLGLIETARYGNSPFSYNFLPIDKENSFFSLGISI